jgi:hypothetical protein
MLSTVENLLRKFTFDGTIWSASGTASASGAQNLTGISNAGAVQLYLAAPSSLLTFLDASGYNGALSGTSAVIATAATNTAFRGVGIITIPEPSCALLLGSAMLAVLGRRRRKTD